MGVPHGDNEKTIEQNLDSTVKPRRRRMQETEKSGNALDFIWIIIV